MIVCVVLDKNNGMLFNSRRQSQDKVLREHLLAECRGKLLWMNKYTSGQFEIPLSKNIIVDEEFLSKASENDYCLVENTPLERHINKIEKIVVFRWNKIYPADVYFGIPLLKGNWNILSSVEFEGSSHKAITKEVWVHEKE